MRNTFKKVFSLVLALSMIVGVLAGINFSAQAAGADDNGMGVARVLNGEGIVLLKNEDNALPLKKGANIAIFGEGQHLRLYTASDFNFDNSMQIETLAKQHGYIPWGAGSSRSLGVGGKNAGIDPLDAFNYAESQGRITVYDDISQKYVAALESSYSDESFVEYVPTEADYQGAVNAGVDTAVVVISRFDGECVDMPVSDWTLHDSEKSVLQNATKYFDKVIVVLNTPAPIDTSWSFDNDLGIDVDALLFAGYGGMQGGWAIADVVLGDVNPSGKLVTTYAKTLDDYPTTESFINDTSVQKYTEDIFLGYRYFETFDPTYSKVNYEFGFGLSYTDFTIEATGFNVEGNNVNVTVKVTNTGTVPGKEVVQLYASAPQGMLGKAAKELAGFDKTQLLQPGASETLTITCDITELASYDDMGKTGNKSAYVLEAGDYNFFVGNSVKEAGTRLAGTHKISDLIVVEQLTEQAKTTLDKRLLADGTLENLDSAEAVVNETTIKDYARIEAEFWYQTPEAKSGYTAQTEVFTGKLFNIDTWAWETYTGVSPKQGDLIKSIVYKVNVEETGEYYVSVRAAANKNAKKGAQITVLTSTDNVAFTTYETLIGSETNLASGSNYHGYEDLNMATPITLQKGANYIKLAVGVPCNIDSFSLSRKGGAMPVANNGSTYIPAEVYYDIVDNATAVSKSFAGDGTFYNASTQTWDVYNGYNIESMWRPGSYVTFRVYVENDGNFKVKVRAASTVATTGFDILTSTNGTDFAADKNLGEFKLTVNTKESSGITSGNAQYNNYMDVDVDGYLSLKKGVNYIRFAKGSFTAPNISAFTLTEVFNYPTVNFNTSVNIEGENYLDFVGNSSYQGNTIIETSNGCKLYQDGQWVSYNNTHLKDAWRLSAVYYQVYCEKEGDYGFSLLGATNTTSTAITNFSVDSDNYTKTITATLLDTYTESGNKYNGYKLAEAEGVLRLKKGLNTIKVTFGSGRNIVAPNIDYFTVFRKDADSYYQLKDVVSGTITLDQFVAQMTSDELATFFVSYPGTTNFGASDAVNQKYGFSRAAVSDGPSGIGSKGTSFPCETVIASTWNTDLVEAFGRVMGSELYDNNVDVWLAPGMNLHRNPLLGRCSEYYSEDPYLSAIMATTTVKAVQQYGVSVCIKHFVCNEKENNKLSCEVRVSERALREIYLMPFEMCIKEGKAQGLMSSYNHINGYAMSENHDILTNIVRGEWGYEYYISGDWNNNNDIIAEINAGHGVREPYSYCDVNAIIDAIDSDKISRETLETGAKYILNTLIMSKRNYTKYSNEVCAGGHTYTNTVCDVCHAPNPQVFCEHDAAVVALAGNITRTVGYKFTVTESEATDKKGILLGTHNSDMNFFDTGHKVAQFTVTNNMESRTDIKIKFGIYVKDDGWKRVKEDYSYTYTSDYDEVHVTSGWLVIPYGCTATLTQDISDSSYDTFTGTSSGVAKEYTRDQYNVLIYMHAPNAQANDSFYIQAPYASITKTSILGCSVSTVSNDVSILAPGKYNVAAQIENGMGEKVDNADEILSNAGISYNAGNVFEDSVHETYVARATDNADYKFSGWYDEDGNLISKDKYYRYTTESVPAGQHTLYARYKATANSITGATLDIGSTLSVNFFAKLDQAHQDAVLKVTRNNKTEELTGVYDGETGYYMYTYTDINPQCMSENITAQLVLNDEVFAVKNDYSVKKYADNLANKTAAELKISNEKYVELITLLSDMLVYGDEAQKYQDYKTDEYATKDIDWLKPSEFTKPDGVRTITGNTDAANKVVSIGLNMGDANKIYFRLNLTDNDVQILLNNKAVDRSELVGNVLYTEDIKATDFAKVYTIKLVKGETVISTVEYNVNAYIAQKYNSASVGALITALNNYGVSANAYKG